MRNIRKRDLFFLGILVLGIVFLVIVRDDLATSREDILLKKSNIETQLQRRSDLIPNLLTTLKAYMKHEDEIYTEIAESRTKLLASLTNGDANELANANSELTEALNNALLIVENYPELASNEQFIGFQDELAGTENRITVARRYYNEAVEKYNRKLKTFPGIMVTEIFEFYEAEYFEVSEREMEVPIVDFSK